MQLEAAQAQELEIPLTDGSKIYAHKAADNSNTIAASDMDGAALETTFFTTLKTLFLEIRTNYIAHIGNKKASDGSTVARSSSHAGACR